MDWELTSDDSVSGQVAETFNVTGGTVMFGDGVRIKNITLQVSKILACEQALKLNREPVSNRDAKFSLVRCYNLYVSAELYICQLLKHYA